MTRIDISTCRRFIWSVLLVVVTLGCAQAPQYDLIIRNGTVYDGSGAEGTVQDVAVRGDRIAAVGDLGNVHGREELDVTGLAVAPGFIDMLNHSETSLIADGRAQSGIRQGVTLEVFGESSMGPLNAEMKALQQQRQGDIKYDITWTTLGEYLESPRQRAACRTNVASFVARRPCACTRSARQPATDARRTRPDARTGARGDGRGRDGIGDGAHLRAGLLREDRGAR